LVFIQILFYILALWIAIDITLTQEVIMKRFLKNILPLYGFSLSLYSKTLSHKGISSSCDFDENHDTSCNLIQGVK
jgi:hypothetical protein